MFNLAKDVRDCDSDSLRSVLSGRIAEMGESFDGVRSYRLNQRNRRHIRYLLARMTAWIEDKCGIGVGFAEYANRQRKHPFEVEHILANKPERHRDEFDHQYEFEDHRNQFGALLLLPKDFNASFGSSEYREKLPNYLGQNLLAASLNPTAYERNPSFVNLITRSGLPFKPYTDGFRKSDIEERQDLYRQICEHVWNPERLGFGSSSSRDVPAAAT